MVCTAFIAGIRPYFNNLLHGLTEVHSRLNLMPADWLDFQPRRPA